MEEIKAALMKWGEAMQITMENRSLYYSPVLDQWRVKKWAGKGARSFIYEGADFTKALEHLLGPNVNTPPQTAGAGTPGDSE
jgi:hypothetical protein